VSKLSGPVRIFDLPGFRRMGGQGRMLRPNATGLLTLLEGPNPRLLPNLIWN
jgi:hypothetical protein